MIHPNSPHLSINALTLKCLKCLMGRCYLDLQWMNALFIIFNKNNCNKQWLAHKRRSFVCIQISQFFNVFLSISPVFLGMSSYISNSCNNGWNGCIKGSGCVGIKRELAGKQYRAGAVDEMSLRHERIPRLH